MPQPSLDRTPRCVRARFAARVLSAFVLGFVALPLVPVRAANLPLSQPAVPSSSRFT